MALRILIAMRLMVIPAILEVQAQRALAAGAIGTVATETAVGEDRAHLAVELDGRP